MKRRKILLLIPLAIIGIVIVHFVMADIPTRPSHVYVSKHRLIVRERLRSGKLGKKEPYIIKGITWSPATGVPDEGPDPANPDTKIPYGFFFDWANRNAEGGELLVYWLRNEHKKYYKQDIPLLAKMNVNTVRLYTDFGDSALVTKDILDEFYRHGIMVIMTVASSRKDMEGGRYAKIVKMCKDHPAILMWCLGNEWNLEYNKYWGYRTVKEAAKATNRFAKKIKKLDPFHPVASSLGDRFFDEEETNTIRYIVKTCPNVDIWGLNIYRGDSFHDLFNQWRAITRKPMFLSEFGIDSFHTSDFTKAVGIQADDCVGEENQRYQVEYALSLWKEIEPELSAINPKRWCLGGTIHSFNDCLWKSGSYHSGLGGLVDYHDSDERFSYRRYDTEGFHLPGSSPDNVLNEEYFGIVDAERKPKEAYWKLKEYYSGLGSK